MRILVINREPLDKIPPLISVIEILRDLKHDISVITCGMPESISTHFEADGIKNYIVYYKVEKNIYKKLQNVISYRKNVYEIIDKYNPEIVWLEGGGTFRLLRDLTKKYRGIFILQISELYQKNKKIHNSLQKLVPSATAIVMPEYNRAVLFQIKYGLQERPFVLPNKPYFWLTKEMVSRLEVKYKRILSVFASKKVILYQGIIHKERDLTNYIKAVKELGNEFQMVLLGPDWGMLDYYKSIDNSLIHIDYIPAPDYLIFTMNAYIGIVTYDPKDLNCAYCAPNKLYEYAKYNLPMLGNDIPGLRYTISNFKAGVIIDEKSSKNIIEGIKMINQQYNLYSKGARKLFDEADNVSIIERIINTAKEKVL